MADYFTQFSEMITDLTDCERAWIKARIRENSAAQDEDAGGFQEDGRVMDFSWDFELEGLIQESHFWIYADAYGDIDCVANFVQKFLAKFRPDDTFQLTYANTCSKPRPGSFSAGALYVTATETKHCDGSCIFEPPTKEKVL